jgi:hypothetical protein
MPPSKKGAPPPRERLCGNCLHFKAEAESPDVGECRLHPPTVLYDAEEGAFAVYPMVAAAEDWCGQHRGSQ